ncbi:MAG: hypothetical protein WBL19_00795 [Minisyncoccia bacterium]
MHYLPHIKRKFRAKIRPALERLRRLGENRGLSIQAEFDELCKRARSPSALKTILRYWIERARSINNEKLRDFCDWLIMIRVPSQA